MRYLVLLPGTYDAEPNSRYPVLFLLHGGFGAPDDWVRQSHLAEYARDSNLIIVMPQGDNSYYVNAALRPEDRYEDYVVDDLSSDVQSQYRAVAHGAAIAGVSMGGFGALDLGLKHSDRYSFVGSISNAADAPDRRFSFHRFGQSWRLRRTFGPKGSVTQIESSPFFLIKSIKDPTHLPFIFQACGRSDSLIGVNRRLDAALTRGHIVHTYRESDGAHDWGYWDVALKDMLQELKSRLQLEAWKDSADRNVHPTEPLQLQHRR